MNTRPPTEREERSIDAALLHDDIEQINSRLLTVEDRLINAQAEISKLKEAIERQEPTMTNLNHLISAGIVTRWIFIGSIGILSTVAVGITAWDSIRNYFK